MQACHASIEAGARFHHPPGCHLVLLAVANERELHTALATLDWHSVCYSLFYEPDNNIGYSAACTQPVVARHRRLFRRYPLWISTATPTNTRAPPALFLPLNQQTTTLKLETRNPTLNIEPETLNNQYTVLVDDNFHYMDESYRYKLGDFPTCEAAISACKSIVDSFLQDHHKLGMTAEELYQGYTTYGEDPFIYSRECRFSAWTYAKARCTVLCKH